MNLHHFLNVLFFVSLHQDAREQGRHYVEKDIVGAIVLTRYNNRTYRICGIDRGKTPEDVFDKDGEKVNYIQYYYTNYNIEIRDRKQNLIIATSSNFEKKQKQRKLFLVPELCYITGLTPSMQNNFMLKKLLIQRTQLAPPERVRRYREFLNRINESNQVQEELEKWQVGYESELLQVKGTLLAPEKVIVGNGAVPFNQGSADFTRELRARPMFKRCEFPNWHIIYEAKEDHLAEDFFRQAREVAREYGKCCYL